MSHAETDDTTQERLPGASGTEWTIRHGDHVATVVQVGGALRRYDVGGRPVVSGFAEGEASPAFRGKLLVPWPNRIGDGEYTFEGTTRLLAHTEPERHNALGGLACWLPFTAVHLAEDEVTLRLDLLPQPGWDWILRIDVTYTLGASGLTVTTRATNLSQTPAPFGFGAHPYVTAGEERVDDLVLVAPARSRLVVDDRLVAGRAADGGPQIVPVDPSNDFRGDDPVGDRDVDLAYTDLDTGADGRWTVELRGPERTTRVWADAATFPWLQIYSGGTLPEPARRRTGVAVEPMTCPPGAFDSGRDLIVLQPGQAWSGTFGIDPTP